jgi:hypothetical protein
MSESSSSSSSGGNNNGGLYMIVGALVVVVGLGAFLYFGGVDGDSGSSTTTIERVTPDKPDVNIDATIKKD